MEREGRGHTLGMRQLYPITFATPPRLRPYRCCAQSFHPILCLLGRSVSVSAATMEHPLERQASSAMCFVLSPLRYTYIHTGVYTGCNHSTTASKCRKRPGSESLLFSCSHCLPATSFYPLTLVLLLFSVVAQGRGAAAASSACMQNGHQRSSSDGRPVVQRQAGGLHWSSHRSRLGRFG
jgi:hypothetical protein